MLVYVSKKTNIYFAIELSLREVRACADDAKIVRSRDAQCITEESP